MKRRDFLKLMGLATGAAVTVSCGTRAKIVSELHGQGGIPGEGVKVPSVCTACPAGCPVTARVVEGWPVKLEGEHGLCLRGQAQLAGLYHPDRLSRPSARSGGALSPTSWPEALRRVREKLDEARRQGKTNVWLHGFVPGALSVLLDDFCRQTGTLRCGELEALRPGALVRAGRALGLPGLPLPDLSTGDVWVTVGADLFGSHLNPVEFGRQYGVAAARESFQWYHLEAGLSLTGIAAGTRLTLRPGSEALVLEWLLHHVRRREGLDALYDAIPNPSDKAVAEAAGLDPRRLKEIADALDQAAKPGHLAGGLSLAQAGGDAAARASVALQASLGMFSPDRLKGYLPPRRTDLPPRDLPTLLAKDRCGVLILSHLSDAAYFPELAQTVSRAAFRVGLTALPAEWNGACDLLLPTSHILESWGDAEPCLGMVIPAKPALARPLHDTLAEGDILLRLMGLPGGETWETRLKRTWQERGVHFGAPARPVRPPPPWETDPQALATVFPSPAAHPVPATGVTLYLTPSVRSYDGRGKALPLLQEIPDPIAAVSYGAFALLGPDTAQKAALEDGDTARIEGKTGAVEVGIRVLAGTPPDVVLLPLEHRGALAIPRDPATGDFLLRLDGVRLTRVPAGPVVTVLSGGRDAHGRGITEPAAPGAHSPAGHPTPEHQHPEGPIPGRAQPSLYPPHEHPDYRWGMAVDLARCTGCSACVGACYVENNVALTGADEHRRGREMAWLRIQPYDRPGGGTTFLPMMCQQCDHAPCEPVCPVYAAYHNDEGLNVQVYNRCVGTRYCANNCPYKVRRFNWFDHAWAPPADRGLNPDVSVRPRGVMEKCTFCIQRIRWAKDHAKDEGRKVRDGEIVPACAQTCPSGAIVFGNLLDPNATVSRWARDPRAYRVLEDIGARPAVYYLQRKT